MHVGVCQIISTRLYVCITASNEIRVMQREFLDSHVRTCACPRACGICACVSARA
jgi:hypothetical protein